MTAQKINFDLYGFELLSPMNRITTSDILKELQISTSRSGGPGGQHVNKVETKVTLRWNVIKSEVLTDVQKELIRVAHAPKLTKEGELIFSAEAKRSQLKNRELAFKKLDRMLAKAFTKRKTRKPTQPTKAAKQQRLTNKKKLSEKKERRRKII